ncbi:hypothetical protein RB6322 [Rhodopirellula baltica SH 1]|uniref:Uncharacterized protein n=1 Tax=Rhodopirellula baltica (strain DSM 10527 / NCIMB 13988 / SH1) TaxID=243090 RepID=Q7UQH8_RHOBA|nr:hypothetical protein RB6322 [Rhodopirellula baltica SH 1]
MADRLWMPPRLSRLPSSRNLNLTTNLLMACADRNSPLSSERIKTTEVRPTDRHEQVTISVTADDCPQLSEELLGV